MFSGRPLSLHEARLPQVSREMMQTGDWLIPQSGGRPWLERPPFPHWCTVAVSFLFRQHADQVWVVRLPAALAGCVTVLLSAWMAARLFGRWTGICSGLVLATAFEFYTYSCLAEDDIFLAALVAAVMALFVGLEFPGGTNRDERTGFFGSRPWAMAALFVMLGLTNLAKGPLVGAAVVIATIGAFLLPMRDWPRLRRYIWLWGWLLFLAVSAAWPLAVYHQFHAEALDNWKFDYKGTSEFDNPFWYYPVQLLGALAPWTPAVFLGLWQTASKSKRSSASPERFLWCWAILPILVLSIPHRKHHHYLVPSLAPWAILASLGLRDVARSMFDGPLWSRKPLFGFIVFGLPGAAAIILFHTVKFDSKTSDSLLMSVFLAVGWLFCVVTFYLGLLRQNGRIVMGTFVTGLALAYCWGHRFIPDRATQEDTFFLQRVEAEVPRDGLLFINSDLHGELDFFREGFYLRKDARLLHNLTFLRDEKITAASAYVLTREWDEPKLASLGRIEIVDQSTKSRPSQHAKNLKTSKERFTLYRLTFDPHLARYPAPTHISTMQAMGRLKGPYCGPELPE